MQIVHAGEEIPSKFSMSLFLAGPTPRSPLVPSWRPEALRLLAELGYDGVVFVPEPRDDEEDRTWTHEGRVAWERAALNCSDRIAFWIPRKMDGMPGLTTNQELGFWLARDPARVLLGFPPDAEHVRYQLSETMAWAGPVDCGLSTLGGLMSAAARSLKEARGPVLGAAPRELGQRAVPLHIWKTAAFQAWHEELVLAGNRLDDARVEWVFRVGPTRRTFLWAVWVKVWIGSENRYKENEVVLGRPDISAVVAYQRGATPMGTQVVMIDEFRSPARNSRGLVRELPSGSSASTDLPLHLAAAELEEETGLVLDPLRFYRVDDRQVAATLSAHHAALYAVALTAAEMDAVKARAGTTHGVEADTERCYLRVQRVCEILEDRSIDWGMIGMILQTVL